MGFEHYPKTPIRDLGIVSHAVSRYQWRGKLVAAGVKREQQGA